jgi:penicillin-insensitive murein endopeptidase
MRAAAVVVLSGAFALGCMGSPTPLAPAIGGSVGVPHQGVLTDSMPLEGRGPGYRRLRDDGMRYGNPRLVRAIEEASGIVHSIRPGGAPLVIGDLSAKYGGASSGHRSHRNGRDADLLFYVTTPAGRSVQSPGFVRFGADGLAEAPAGGYVRIDLERQWLLVKSLVSSREANVQWLFIARWLEALIIEYARARGEDPELIWYAESVLLQPGDSLSHDDHLHFRVACTPDEAVAGCLGGGPYWSWLPRLPQLGPVPDEALFTAIAEDLLPPPSIAASSLLGP